jgi:hypothetical protein
MPGRCCICGIGLAEALGSDGRDMFGMPPMFGRWKFGRCACMPPMLGRCICCGICGRCIGIWGRACICGICGRACI